VPLYERKGIGHQVSAELGYATPGAMAVHFDGHISQLGTFGTLGMGIRRKFLEALVRERVQLKVPQTMRVNLTGTLQTGVMARDVFHHIVRELGPTAGRFQVMEISGPGLASISLEGRQTINCLAMFAGAVTSIMEPDNVTLPWVQPRQRLDIEPLYSDPDASYAAVHEIDISGLEPIVVIPPSPANTRNLAEHKGTKIDVGYLGSCASGRLEDLEIAARILKGKKIRDGFQLHVVPTSNDIMEAAAAKGYLTDIIGAGAFVQSSSCDHCFGRIGVMTKNQNAISTGTLNTPGRMGSTDSQIFIANAASVAAAALTGEITDPRDYL
jgi:3-isopropylmalate/(R)-2-methylmalate dehydratase large subunit